MCFENKRQHNEIGNYIASEIEQSGFLLKDSMILDILGNLTIM